MPSRKSSTSSKRAQSAFTQASNYLGKGKANHQEILPYESLLASGLKDFLRELTMVNGGAMVSYVCNNQHANLNDIIGSSMEGSLKPGRLFYAEHAEIDFDWGEAPSVAFAMELHDAKLTAFFNVIFGSDHVGVDIRGISFADALGEPEQNLRRFAAAVADAREPQAAKPARRATSLAQDSTPILRNKDSSRRKP